MMRSRRTWQVPLLCVGLLWSALAVLIGPAAAPADAATTGKYLHDIQIVEGNGAACPDGYSRDGTDLNESAGGAYLYACWNFSDSREGAVTRIRPQINDGDCPSGTERRGPNLNKGVDNSERIYLCIGFSVNTGPPIGNVDVLWRATNFFCASEKGSDFDWYNAGRNTYGTAANGVDFNDGAGIGSGYIHLCVKPVYEDTTVRLHDLIGSTVIGRIDTWWPTSLSRTVHMRCPSGFGYNVNWRDRSPSDSILASELANADTAERSFIVSNPDPIDDHRVVIDIACSKYDFPVMPPGQGDTDSGCGGEGERVCTGAVKLSKWRAADWQYNAHPGWSCDRGLILNGSEECVDLTRHDLAAEHDSWETWAIEQQFNVLGGDEPINLVPMFQTHNSYNNRADSYPVPNHFRSTSDQLDMGTRWLDLRPRWGKGGPLEEHLRLSHGSNDCGTGCTTLDRPYYLGVQEIANWLDDNPDEVLLIGAQSTEHQVVGDDADNESEAEVMAYLVDPLRKYIGRDRILGPREWCDALHPSNASTACAGHPHDSFSGSDYTPSRWPTRNEIKALGAQVMVVADAESDVTFSVDFDTKHAYGNDFVNRFDADACTMDGLDTNATLRDFQKIAETRIFGQADFDYDTWPGYLYAYADEVPDDNTSTTNRPFPAEASSVEEAIDCNLHVNLDMLGDDDRFNGTNDTTYAPDGNPHKDRREAMVWSWRPGDRGRSNTCVVLAGNDGRFESRGCGEEHKVACARPTSGTTAYRQGDPAAWTDLVGGSSLLMTSTAYRWDRSFEACAAEFPAYDTVSSVNGVITRTTTPAAVPAVPTNKVQATALHATAGADDVWLSLTNRRADGQWAIQRTPPPVVNFVLSHVDGTDYTAGDWTNKDVLVTFTCAVGSGRTKTTDTLTPSVTVSAEGENQSVTSSGTCADDAGNQSFDVVVDNIDIDKTAPVASGATVSPAANAAGWHNVDVTVSRTCSDTLAGVEDADQSTTLTADGADQQATLTCTDRAGNVTSATTTDIDIDTTVPTVTNVHATTAKAPSGWYLGAVDVQGDCADPLSGVSQPTASARVTGDGADQTVAVVCVDRAGNRAEGRLGDIDVDQTPPTMSPAQRVPAANTYGWNNTPVTVSHVCADATSGPVTPTASGTVTGDGANQSVAVVCSDVAGNKTTVTTIQISIDTAAPSPGQANLSPSANAAGWWKSAVTVSRSCTDALSGVVRSSESTVVTSDGAGQSVTLTCTDKAGNTSPAQTTGINIDTKAPRLGDPVRSPAPNGFGWHRSDVTVTRSCSDDLSGAAAASVSGTIRNEGADQSITLTCLDVAGNRVSGVTGDIDLDETPPVVQLSGQQGSYGVLDTVVIDCIATDALSGLATTCDDVDRRAYLFDPGKNSVAASVMDRADNPAATSAVFEVYTSYDELCSLTKQLLEPGTASKPMCQQLTNAQKAETAGRTGSRESAMASYDRLLDNAKKRGSITPENVAILKKWSRSLLAGPCRRCVT